ncbi:class I SAM-dependent methyltransferase [Shewanella sp. Isolate8]|uniref:class I SAM-dependent methyltransferase n=1 Tax=Shewanella sp. Isolate8 TaxID=2908529 RepID=UPI001EFD6974|nr:class I SAM-dependent methyltransferase [Shewanella sp. Isolate8]MCG9745213.1 class I SAM-dependent methyltransferase [Shewanella sp. Isolate8]
MTKSVQNDKDYGGYISDSWVPAPRFAMRRQRVLNLLTSYPKGKLLEIGPGAGSLMRDLALEEFSCIGYETATEARKIFKLMTEGMGNVQLTGRPSESWNAHFDYILSCEVLEHIEDDKAALKSWVSYLKVGGLAIITVPSHSRKFGPSDEWAGHCRRYDKDVLISLIERSGLSIIHFETYGFPLANISSFVLKTLIKRSSLKQKSNDKRTATARSGVERTAEGKLYRFQTNLLGRSLMRIAFKTQYLFRNTELGDGFIVVAKKNAN